MDNADSSYTQRSTIGMSECCTFVGNYFNEKPFIEEKKWNRSLNDNWCTL